MKTLSTFFVFFAIVAGIAAITPAFASDGTTTISTPAGTSVPGCEETNECFIPAEVTIHAGDTVEWSNDDTAAHTVTSGSAADGPDGVFDSSLFMAGTTYSFTFADEGTYDYFCMVHPWMVGTVIVEAEAAEEMMEDTMMEEEHTLADHADEPHLVGMLSDGTEVELWVSEPMAGEAMEVIVDFHGKEHANFDILVTQNGEEVLYDDAAHHHEGSGDFYTEALSSSDPVDITITFEGYGIDEMTGPIGEKVVFSSVVPEFGTIAMMILGVAIVSIIAVSAKSKLMLPKL